MCYEIVKRAKRYKDQVAVYSEGEAWKYGSIIHRAQHFATLLLGQKDDLVEARVEGNGPVSHLSCHGVKDPAAISMRIGRTNVRVRQLQDVLTVRVLLKCGGVLGGGHFFCTRVGVMP